TNRCAPARARDELDEHEEEPTEGDAQPVRIGREVGEEELLFRAAEAQRKRTAEAEETHSASDHRHLTPDAPFGQAHFLKCHTSLCVRVTHFHPSSSLTSLGTSPYATLRLSCSART